MSIQQTIVGGYSKAYEANKRCDKRAVIKTDHEAYFEEASFIKGQLKSKMVRGSLKDTTISTLICPWTLSLKSLYSSSMSNDGMSVARTSRRQLGPKLVLAQVVLANLGGASLYFTMW